MYGTGAGVWSSSNIQSATGSSGQGVTWTFYDTGPRRNRSSFMMPAVKRAFLGAIGDLGGMRNPNLDAYSSTGPVHEPHSGQRQRHRFRGEQPNIVVRVGNSGTAASDVAYSSDNGQTWQPATGTVPGYGGPNQMQSVAVSADGARFLASPYAGHGSPAYTTNNGTTWTTCSGLPSGAKLASDRVTAGTFYATSGSTLYVSTNGGASFSTVNTFSGSGAPRAVFGKSGEVWVAAGSGGLYRFTGSGATKTQNHERVVCVWRRVRDGGQRPVSPGGVHHRDRGRTVRILPFRRRGRRRWKRINDNAHQFGWLQGNYIGGDENVFGRVYLDHRRPRVRLRQLTVAAKKAARKEGAIRAPSFRRFGPSAGPLAPRRPHFRRRLALGLALRRALALALLCRLSATADRIRCFRGPRRRSSRLRGCRWPA